MQNMLSISNSFLCAVAQQLSRHVLDGDDVQMEITTKSFKSEQMRTGRGGREVIKIQFIQFEWSTCTVYAIRKIEIPYIK